MCLLPETWALRVRVCDARGRPKVAAAGDPAAADGAQQQGGGSGNGNGGGGSGAEDGGGNSGNSDGEGDGDGDGPVAVEAVVQDVAGPLCFQGDRVARAALLPRIDAGDHVLVLDAGAYTLSMASRYNSRPSPAVLGFACARVNGGGGAATLRVLRARERVEDVVAYWNLGGGAGEGAAAAADEQAVAAADGRTAG